LRDFVQRLRGGCGGIVAGVLLRFVVRSFVLLCAPVRFSLRLLFAPLRGRAS
jgi:hypothetical protein